MNLSIQFLKFYCQDYFFSEKIFRINIKSKKKKKEKKERKFNRPANNVKWVQRKVSNLLTSTLCVLSSFSPGEYLSFSLKKQDKAGIVFLLLFCKVSYISKRNMYVPIWQWKCRSWMSGIKNLRYYAV